MRGIFEQKSARFFFKNFSWWNSWAFLVEWKLNRYPHQSVISLQFKEDGDNVVL